MAATSFFSLPPEILVYIGHYLTQHDLAQCVRVCKEWSSYLTPCLWSEMIVCSPTGQSNNNDNNSTREINTPEFIIALVRNKRQVRHVKITDPSLLFLLVFTSPKLQNLQSLDLCLHNEVPDDSPIWSSEEMKEVLPMMDELPESMSIWHRLRASNWIALNLLLMMNSTSLRRLSIDEGCLRDHLGRDVSHEVIAVFPTASLERLEMSFDGQWRRRQDGGNNEDNGDPPELPRPIPPDGQVYFEEELEQNKDKEGFNRLREVTIRSNDFVDSEVELMRLAFLARCGALRSLTLDGVFNWNVWDLMCTLMDTCQLLEQLTLVNVSDLNDTMLALILGPSQGGWRVLRLTDLVGFEGRAFESLMENMTTLEDIRVGCWRALGQGMVLDFLCSAIELRWLVGPEVRGWTTPNNKICEPLTVHAYDAYQEHFGYDGKEKKDRTWALGSKMKMLQLHIVGVPRSDVVCDLKGNLLQPVAEGECRHEVQRWIYEQLGRMTGLEDLVLGSVNCDMTENDQQPREGPASPRLGFQYQSLEFSMESGLELLSGMKELRVLDIWLTAHRIGVAELDWMHVNWPKLKTIVGWDSDRAWTGDVEGNLVWKADVRTWMAAHPLGIGSSYYL